MTDLRAISVRAPWWWFIVHGFKDLENRPRAWSHRGHTLIHASTWWSGRQVRTICESIIEDLREQGRWTGALADGFNPDHLKEMGGRLVGEVDVVDCIDAEPKGNMWWYGPHALVMTNAKPLKKTPLLTGYLGLMTVPASLVEDSANVRLSS